MAGRYEPHEVRQSGLLGSGGGRRPTHSGEQGRGGGMPGGSRQDRQGSEMLDHRGSVGAAADTLMRVLH